MDIQWLAMAFCSNVAGFSSLTLRKVASYIHHYVLSLEIVLMSLRFPDSVGLEFAVENLYHH